MPHLTRDYGVSFYGGEPLLSLAVLRRTVEFLETWNRATGRKARYAVTTNGSLATDDVIDFFGRHKFAVTLSFDGLAQDRQRGRGSYERILSKLEAMRTQAGLRLAVNSVFTAATVGSLSDSMRLLMRLGVPRLSVSLSTLTPWDEPSLERLGTELARLRRMALRRYRRTGEIPVDLFGDDEQHGIFSCAGGMSWLSISPEGRVWGCPLVADYFRGRRNSRDWRRYCFGTLANFRRNPELSHARHVPFYSRLRADEFSTSRGPCFLCPDLQRCSVCPMTAALSGARWGRVPDDLCAIQKIKIRESALFRRDAAKISPPSEI